MPDRLIVVGNPTEPPHLKHLQLELWLGKPPIDPDPALRGWQLLEIRQLGGDGGDEVSSICEGARRPRVSPRSGGYHWPRVNSATTRR